MENNSFSFGDISPKLKTDRICLLDADYVKYVVCNNIYKDYQKKQITGETNVFIKEEPVITYVKQWCNDWFLKIDDPIIFCFSGKSYNTFRNHITFDKQYKGNRTKDYTDYPGKMEDMIKAMKYIQDNYVSLLFTDLEADDIVSVLQDANDTYIVSNDKDLKQVPGWHYDFGANKIYEISNEQALYNLSKQLLTGDTTDHISGLPGIGDVKAQEYLSKYEPKQYILAVLHLYQKKFGIFKGTDMFNETWMLVKMRENRGDLFKNKYKAMFDTKEMLLIEIQKRKITKK